MVAARMDGSGGAHWGLCAGKGVPRGDMAGRPGGAISRRRPAAVTRLLSAAAPLRRRGPAVLRPAAVCQEASLSSSRPGSVRKAPGPGEPAG